MQKQMNSVVARQRWSALVLASAVAAVALPSAAWAQNRTFIGGTDYNTAANWSPADVPDTTAENAIIDAGGAFNVTLSSSLSVNNLTIGSNDALTVANNVGYTIAGAISNAGNFTVASSGNYTDLYLGGASLSGGGTLTVSNYTRLRGGGTFTNSSTIQGENNAGGSFGNNELTIVNAAGGLINANVSAQVLSIDPAAAGGFTNSGTLRASNGGTLLLTGNGGGDFTNTGGTIQAQNASTVLVTGGATVTGGTITSAGTGVVRTSNATFSGITNTGNISVDNSTGLTLAGTITNTGTITVASTGTYADLYAGGATLTSGGTVTLNNYARVRGGGTLTNQGLINGVADGGGSLGNNEISIANSGTIDANVSGRQIFVDPVNGGAITNTGIMQASNGATLVLSGNGGGTFTNTAGTLRAQTGSTVLINAGASVTGGTITTVGTGIVRTSNATFTGITNTGNVSIDNSTGLSLVGTITNNGTLTVDSTGTFADLSIDPAGVTLNGTGTLVLNNYARVRGSGTLTNNSTIVGVADGGGSLGNNEISVVNTGLINANVNGRQLFLDPVNGGSVTNTGTMQASNSGALVLTGSNGGTFTNTGGTIQALAGSQVQLTGGASVTGGTITSAGSGTVVVPGGQSATINGAATLAGTLNVANAATLTLTGAITENATINVQSSGSFTDLVVGGATLAGTGTINLTNADRVRGGGTFTIGSGITVQGETTNGGSIGNNETAVINNGLINANVSTLALTLDPVNVAGAFTNHGTLRASSGGILVLTGSNGGDFVNTGATIEALAGSQVQLTGGAVVTGGAITSTGTGTVVVPGGQSATINGPATLAGTLNVSNAASLTLTGAIAHNGVMNVTSTGSFTDLLVGGVTLSGTGTINLQNADRVHGGGVFTIGSGNVIQGETTNGGSIGNNDTAVVNNGLINANVSTLALTIDPVNINGAFTNHATLRASSGGILVLTGSNGGDFVNTSATIEALAGSQVQLTSGATVTGGTITSTGTGNVQLNGGTSATLNGPITVGGTFNALNASTLTLTGAVTLNGTLNVQSTGSFTDLNVGGVTLSGTGTVNLQNADRVRGGGVFTIGSGNTVQGDTAGGGSLGNNDTAVVNNGLVNANSAAGSILDIDVVNSVGAYTNSATGITRASNGGTLRLNGSNGGNFTNNGTFEALNGSTFTFIAGADLTNSSGGTLTGGIYRSVATNPTGVSTLNLPGGAISVNAADVTISGTGSVFGQIDTITQTTSAGKFRVLDGRNFTTVGNYTNTGITQLGGGTFTATGALNNLTTGETFGFGSITNRIVNSGLIRASGGVLSVGGIDPATTAGTARVDAGATLTLSVATADSTVSVLDNNGNLNVGGFNLLVRSDYTNGNFGTGNSFNPRANVTGGQINASPAVAQTITGANNGTTATPTIALGNIRTGTSVSVPFSVNNVGASGPSLRGAIQTTNAAGFGGNITDNRLSGTGTTAGNFGPVAPGTSTSPYTVIFNGTGAGALSGQVIAVVNNFDNVVDQKISVTGAAYNPAVASVTPNPVFVGNFHVGDTVPGSTITFANTAPAGAFSEDLGVSGVAATGTAALGAGSPTSFNVLAGASNTAVKAAVSTATAGAKSGTITANLASTGAVNGVAVPGLSPLSLTGASVAVTGNVYRIATLSGFPASVALGDRHVGSVATASLSVTNASANDGFSESLAATVTGFTPAVTAASGSATVAPGGTNSSALTATIDTATAGAKSGSVTVGLTSVAVAGTGLSNTSLSNVVSNVTATVYNYAAPQVTNSPISYGIVHVGDVVTPIGVAIKNNAPATFSEKLNATGGTAPAGFTGGGSLTGLTAQSTNNTGIAYGVSTATAAILNANIPINFVSDGTGVNSLGTTNLTAGSVTVTAQVNNYAKPTLGKTSGAGTFSGSGTSYTLAFGTVAQFSANPTALLNLLNDTLAPADTLAGTWTVVASNFVTSGFTPFSGIAAGSSLGGLSVALDTTNQGVFAGTITLAPRSQNSSGYNGALSNVTLNLSGTVLVPEPTAVTALLVAGGSLLGRRTRRAK